ncbi:hypothetical protein IG193_01795 [Infirmifilum lucidum]|uniref:Uncharacterized protein n=1 Tax=Infirmifilum lucidum TaxID=2776706 RepID=A0A7L9FHE0_9CREN|nr:hypothetical protein [Infirmifilum lucidum]QOJ79220.1 hypothetical protein IG193_01795 [Infirmifilum lucidum]
MSYYACVASRLRDESLNLCDIATCAVNHWNDVEVVVSSITSLEEAEKVRSRLDRLSRVQGPCTLDNESLTVLSLVVEVFLGGLDLALLDARSLEGLQRLYELLVESGALPDERPRVWRRIIAEVRERAGKEVMVFEGGSATPVLAVFAEDITWSLGYLWPVFVEQVRGEGADSVIGEAVSAIRAGKGVEFSGPRGSGKLSLMYQTLVELSREGFTLYAGAQSIASKLVGKKVVFTPGKPRVIPAGWGGEYVQIDVNNRYTAGELEEIVRRLADWDGVSLAEPETAEVLKNSSGNPGYVETTLLYVSLSKLHGRSFVIPKSIEEAGARLKKVIPEPLLNKLAVPASLGSRCFPTSLLEVSEEEEALLDRLLLRHDAYSLYSWRSDVSREIFKKTLLSPPNIYEHVFTSESPFHAAWSTVVGAPGTARYIALAAINNISEEASIQALEAVAVLSSGTISRLLRGATAFRLGVLARAAESAGSLAVAEELVSKALGILGALGSEELRSEYASLAVKLAELRVSRFLPELALQLLDEVRVVNDETMYDVSRVKGVAYLGMGLYSDAERHLREALRYAEERELKQEYYSLRVLLVDAMLGGGRSAEAVEEVDRLVKELVRKECTLVGILYDAAVRWRQLKGRTNYAVCATLMRCGYPDLAGAYGCFEK